MAHCAEIDNNGVVKRVIVTNDKYGYLTCEQWCERTYGGTWKQTSYNTKGGVHYGWKVDENSPKRKLVYVPDNGLPLRKNYAGVGYVYDKVRDAFIPPKIFNSWILNEKTCQYNPPIEYPKDGKIYEWDEKITNWKLIPDNKGVIL